MSSYFERVIGNLSSSEIARSEDIHEIQTNIQTAFIEMIKDTYGYGCILDDDEDALKIYPTPDHIDQENKNYDDDDEDINANLISFYDRYFKQLIHTEKSEIQSIRVQLKNESSLEPTIYAEIRDNDMNLLKESNIVLPSTVENDDPIEVEFTFNLTHLPIGDYFFILRPVDITTTDIAQSDNGSLLDNIGPQSFQIRYDRGGNYTEGLEASYNGVDYLPANLLDDQVTWDSENSVAIAYETNYDLYFEQVYSSGNTYLINPAACMVMGQKTYPIDTHVTIDGPSRNGNRIDLISLTDDGLLNVTSGEPFTGTAQEENYPINTSGFKVAYITTYQNSIDSWVCPNCGTTNQGNIVNCANCDNVLNLTNTRIPLIEQDDDNGITRQRDVLERLRRLEKKLDYQIQNNIPSRIKYTCTVDPTMATKGELVTVNVNGKDSTMYVNNEDSYRLSSKTDSLTGETVVDFKDELKETFIWSIVKKITTTKTSKKTTAAKISASDLTITLKENAKKKNKLFTISVNKRTVTNVSTVKKNSKKTTTTTKYESTAGIPNVKVDVYIKNSKGKTVKTLKNQKTNSKGLIKINILDKYKKIKKGTYKIVTKYGNKKISNTLKVTDSASSSTSNTQSVNIVITDITDPVKSVNVGDKVITGDDSFYRDNMTIDTDKGEVYIKKQNTTKKDKTTWYNISKDKRKEMSYSNQSFKVKSSTKSQQSTYAMLNLDIKSDCTIYSIKPYIKSFTNISKYKIVLFKNDKIFNLNSGRTSYIKKVNTDQAKNTNFPNIYASSWVNVKGSSKKNKKTKLQTVTPTSKQLHTFSLGKDGKKLEKGTYSLLILGELKNKKKDGTITIKQYHTNNISKYGSLISVKGTYHPKTIFIENNKLRNRTSLVGISMIKHKYTSTGVIMSKTINTKNNIRGCKIDPKLEIPDSCDVDTYVSNNGGKSYILVGNEKNSVNFTGLGHEFKWRMVFQSSSTSQTPKLKFNGKYALKIDVYEAEAYTTYEDYGRCFATPMLNANAITRNVALNNNIKNKFEEWEFCRLWMEDEDLGATMDICFSYDDDNYTTDVTTKQSSWPPTIFFSQILSNLTVDDFSQSSIDYDNYNADVEYDENNFRFKFDPNMYNTKRTIITTPLANTLADNYDYAYGDITNEDIDMSNFDYGLMSVKTIYKSIAEESPDQYAGMQVVSGPYYQALYNPKIDEDVSTPTETEPSENNEESQESDSATNVNSSIVWAADGDNQNGKISGYDSDACIIGVSFINGFEIKDGYTNLIFDIFPNLRDCKEKEGTTTGELELDDNGNAVIDENKAGKDTSKYIDEDTGYYYIPENTLELVVSLNPYGLIEDDNATYGKAYPINIPLRSCKYTTFSLDLSDLYGSTIYSFGLRVSKKTDEKGKPIVCWNDDQHPSLHSGDILGLGNISISGYNIKPYTPYVSQGYSSRWNWIAYNGNNQKSQAYVLYQSVDANNENKAWSKLPIHKTNPASTYTVKHVKDSDIEALKLYTRHNGTTLVKKGDPLSDVTQKRTENSYTIQIIKNNTVIRKSTTNANAIVFHIDASDAKGPLFKINTDIDLAPYNWIDVQYYLEIDKESGIGSSNPLDKNNHTNTNYFASGMDLMKGEIILDLYDTTDILSSTPIESFALPAWGKTQENYGANQTEYVYKVVHAWFKIHSDASSVKTIVLRKENPTNRVIPDIDLVINNIVFLNTESVPALGPQMHVRIYPQNMDATKNTKIRKFGCVYRIG